MKIYKTASAALIIASIGVFTAMPAFSADRPAEKKEVGKEVKEAVEAIKEYSADQKDEAVKKGKAVLDNLDDHIEHLESRIKKDWDKMGDSARKTAKTSLEAIQKQRDEMAKWVGSMKQSSSGAWEDVKKGFVESYQSLSESFDKAADKF